MGWRVIVIEDPLVGKLVNGILTRGGFEVVQASPTRALELMRDPAERFALVVTNTPELFLERSSSFALLYLAACPDPQWTARCPRCRALIKPFHPEELLAVARELVGAASASEAG